MTPLQRDVGSEEGTRFETRSVGIYFQCCFEADEGYSVVQAKAEGNIRRLVCWQDAIELQDPNNASCAFTEQALYMSQHTCPCIGCEGFVLTVR
jgi:hypothetical protein